jgi:hypothetical protein
VKKRLLITFVVIDSLIVLAVVAIILLLPSMDRWGSTEAERAAGLPGDELVRSPAHIVNRAITIDAPPEQIYPWLVQLGAGKGGFYSYTPIEGLIGCPLVNAERIHPDWQNLQVGDEVKMCPAEPAPPPYIVAQLHPNQALVLGHQEGTEWVDTWQFVLLPQPDGSTRLVLRTRTTLTGGIWEVIRPAVFVMERGMLLGIKARAENVGG